MRLASSKSGRLAAILIAALSVAVLNQAQSDAEAQPENPAKVVVEIRGPHYDAGDPVTVRLTVRNDGDSPLVFPASDPLHAGFALTTPGGEELQPKGPTQAVPALRPARLAPGGYHGQVIDISPFFPVLARPGRYKLVYRWKDLVSNEVSVDVIAPFDETKHYTARIETNQGNLDLELFGDVAPRTVQNFVDLSRQGFYDGLTFHYVRKGEIMVGGDPRGDGTGGSGFRVPAEFNDRKHLTGSVGMVRGVDPDSASSQFYICLVPQPERDNLFTLFGQVVGGLEALDKMEEIPTTGRKERPYFRPLEPLTIQRVVITELEPEDAAS